MSQERVSTFASGMQRALYELVRSYEACDQACLAQHGVTAAQGYTLLALADHSDVTMNELSEAMGLASSTMTRMVDHLVRKGLVGRRHDDEDRRVVRVWLTAEGKRVRCALESERQYLMERVLGEIEENERPTVLSALQKVAKLIRKAMETCCNG